MQKREKTIFIYILTLNKKALVLDGSRVVPVTSLAFVGDLKKLDIFADGSIVDLVTDR